MYSTSSSLVRPLPCFFFLLTIIIITVLCTNDNTAYSKFTLCPALQAKYSIKIRHRMNAPFTQLMYSDTSTNNIAVPILPAWLQCLFDSHIATVLTSLWQCYPVLPAHILWVWSLQEEQQGVDILWEWKAGVWCHLWAAMPLLHCNRGKMIWRLWLIHTV